MLDLCIGKCVYVISSAWYHPLFLMTIRLPGSWLDSLLEEVSEAISYVTQATLNVIQLIVCIPYV